MAGWPRKREDDDLPEPVFGAPDPEDDPDRSYLTGPTGQLVTAPAPAAIDGGLLTSARVKAVRFQRAEPQGYYFPQVEAFVAQVTQSLLAYEERQYATDVALHEARVENEHLGIENRRLQLTIELFRVNGTPLANDDGSYVTESQVSQSDQIVQQSVAEAESRAAAAANQADQFRMRAERAESQLEAMQAALLVAETDADTYRRYGLDLQAYVEQTQEWVASAQQQLTEQAAALAAGGGRPQEASRPVSEPVPVVAQPAYDRPTYAPDPGSGSGPVPADDPAYDPGSVPAPTARLRVPRPDGSAG